MKRGGRCARECCLLKANEHGGTGSDKYAGEGRRLRRHILRAMSTSAGVQGGGGEIGFEAGEAGRGGGGGGSAYRLQLEERAGRRGGGGEIGFEAGEAGRGGGGRGERERTAIGGEGGEEGGWR